ncbi:hypothetical protein KY285_000656 [Solanum tuberosum]|nr:hypothetical protein KY285_000656 [Solanum tuberosum]
MEVGEKPSSLLYQLRISRASLIEVADKFTRFQTLGQNQQHGYYTKLKGLWDELDLLNTKNYCSRICTCGGKNVSSKALQDERLIQFLMGLNDAYSPARSNILMINPFPSVSLEYSLIMRDEKQREVDIQSHFFRKSASYLATNHKIVGTSDLKGRMTNLLCSHCKKT